MFKHCILCLQLLRMESQVKRYKGAADEAEGNIEDMKSEKRKLQKEVSSRLPFSTLHYMYSVF